VTLGAIAAVVEFLRSFDDAERSVVVLTGSGESECLLGTTAASIAGSRIKKRAADTLVEPDATRRAGFNKEHGRIVCRNDTLIYGLIEWVKLRVEQAR
jgi:hypothetical protein